MKQKLTLSTTLMLLLPPLLWAGNAIIGRMVSPLVPPITLNFLRWAIALLILLPFTSHIFRPDSGLWKNWRRLSLLGLLGFGMYNSLQYLALQTSTPINVTLVAASVPIWMLVIGRVFFAAPISRQQLAGAGVSMIGVLIVLARGEWRQLIMLRLVPGDVFMLIAAFAWSIYSWVLARSGRLDGLGNHWATFLAAQMSYGVLWSAAFAASEWSIADVHISWSWTLIAALLYFAIGPSLIAYRCWGAGVQRVGPNITAIFNNLTPLFTALMSATLLGEAPRLYHAAAFLLIVIGIVLVVRASSATPSFKR